MYVLCMQKSSELLTKNIFMEHMTLPIPNISIFNLFFVNTVDFLVNINIYFFNWLVQIDFFSLCDCQRTQDFVVNILTQVLFLLLISKCLFVFCEILPCWILKPWLLRTNISKSDYIVLLNNNNNRNFFWSDIFHHSSGS